MLKTNRNKRRLLDTLKILGGVALVALVSGVDMQSYADQVTRYTESASVRARSGDGDAGIVLCRQLLAQKRYSDMYDVAERGYNQFRTNEWRYLLGLACEIRHQEYEDQEALKLGEKLFRAYVRDLPYDPDGHSQWGWCLSHLGRPDEARREFLKALALDPNNAWAKEKLKYVTR